VVKPPFNPRGTEVKFEGTTKLFLGDERFELEAPALLQSKATIPTIVTNRIIMALSEFIL